MCYLMVYQNGHNHVPQELHVPNKYTLFKNEAGTYQIIDLSYTASDVLKKQAELTFIDSGRG